MGARTEGSGLGPTEPGSAWTHRFAVAAFLSAVPLVLFGGSVTTLGAGMAVEGWLVAEGHFLLFFPIESWFRDTATFVEHTHRLFGVLVGVFTVLAVGAAFRSGTRGTRLACGAALLAVVGQGAVGGFRVLADDPQLAFLHGVLAQAVFAALGACAVVTSRAWALAASSRLPARGADRDALASRVQRLRGFALVVLLLLGAQVFLGAWYRHSLRPVETSGTGTLFLAHLSVAALVMIGVTSLAGRLRGLGDGISETAPGLAAAPGRLVALLGIQVLLGFLAWSGYRPGSVGPLEWAFAIAHVLGGALLLTQCATTWLWLGRACRGSLVEARIGRWREA